MFYEKFFKRFHEVLGFKNVIICRDCGTITYRPNFCEVNTKPELFYCDICGGDLIVEEIENKSSVVKGALI